MKQINLNSFLIGIVLISLGVLLMFTAVAGLSFSITSLLLFLFFVLLTLILYRIYLFTRIPYMLIIVGSSLSIVIITFMGIFIHYYYLWPLFLLSPAIGLTMAYKGKSKWDKTLFIPISMLIGMTITFYVCIAFGWWMMKYIWPTFVLWLAIGVHKSSISLNSSLTKRTSYILYTLFVFLELSAIGMLFKVLWGIVLIALGSLLIYKTKRKR